MNEEHTSSFDDLVQELHRDADFRREYRRQLPYYALLRELIQRRKALGITQRRLEELSGIHQSNISRIESGERDVRLSTIITLAEALDSSVTIQFTPTIPDYEFDLVLGVAARESTEASEFSDSTWTSYRATARQHHAVLEEV